MRNQQPPEKVDHKGGMALQVHSIFYTLQGEGPFAGRPAVFVRLAGCNLQCPGCDTDYTSTREAIPVEQLADRVAEARGPNKGNLVVITGGEPFRQPLAPFIRIMLRREWEVQIETNGTLYQELPEEVVIICSPKTGSINRLLASRITALKYVLTEGEVAVDGYPERALFNGTRSALARPPKGFKGKIYFQPYDSGNAEENKKHEQAAIRSCYLTGNTYCHQIHKLLNLE